MKITNIRSEDLVERITNNDLMKMIQINYLKCLNPRNINITHHLKQLINKTNGEETNTVQMKNID